MRSRIRRVKRTTRRSNGGGALSRISRSRSKLSNRSKRNKMKGGGAISGESDTGMYSLRLDDYLYKNIYTHNSQGNSTQKYYYAVASAFRSKTITNWSMEKPKTLNPLNESENHTNSTTYYQAQLYEVEESSGNVLKLLNDSVGNVKSTRWSEIVKDTKFFTNARGRLRSEFTSGWSKGESWNKIMERLTTLLEAIKLEKELNSTNLSEESRPTAYLAIS